MLINLVNNKNISIENGIIKGHYTMAIILLGGIFSFIFLIISFKFIKTKITKDNLFCNLIINLNKKTVKVIAIIDTGNMLKEPITNIPVIVIEHNYLKGLIHKDILSNIDSILGGDFGNVSEDIQTEYMPKLKVIPYTSLGKQNGMLLGIMVKNIKIEQDNNIKNIEKVVIGLYNKKLSKKEEYHALIGIDVV